MKTRNKDDWITLKCNKWWLVKIDQSREVNPEVQFIV